MFTRSQRVSASTVCLGMSSYQSMSFLLIAPQAQLSFPKRFDDERWPTWYVSLSISFLVASIPPLEYVLTVTIGNGGGYGSQTPIMSRHPSPQLAVPATPMSPYKSYSPRSRDPPQYSQRVNQQYQSQRQLQYYQHATRSTTHITLQDRTPTDRTRTDTSRIFTTRTSTARTRTDSTGTDRVTTDRTEKLETILAVQMTSGKQRINKTWAGNK